MNRFKLLFGTTRPPFLLLAPACALLGATTAYQSPAPMNLSPGQGLFWFHLVLVVVGAVAAHIAVNTFNEYADYKTGLDARTKPTPFTLDG